MRMRLSSTSKPILSPGRTEKFPPPLMRFLRNNVGSRSSRGRTRRTPLFMWRKKALTSALGIETTQEPSSPKVTCIGQVRVRRSKSKNRSTSSKISNKNHPQKCSRSEDTDINNSNSNSNNNSCCCYWFRKPEFCKLNSYCKPNFRKWVLFFSCRSVKVRTDSSKFGLSRFEQDDEQQRDHVDEERERRISISIETETTTMTRTTTTTPPKNALLLTRCRSAPYRSSSLACRFWGSPLRGESEEVEVEVEEKEENKAASGIEVSRDSTSSESRGDRDSSIEGRRSSSRIISLKNDMGVCSQVGNSNELKFKLEVIKGGGGFVKSKTFMVQPVVDTICDNNDNDEHGIAKPLMLMRCKSEPARRDSETLDPLSSEFWRHRRSGNTESSTIHSHAVD